MFFTVINLRRQGTHLQSPEGKWLRPSRRWQWYWMLLVETCGVISSFMAIDVDRHCILELPMILQCVFLTLMVPALLAAVLEAVRTWETACHRKGISVGLYAWVDGHRSRNVEIYMAVAFYLLDLAALFTTSIRDWDTVQMQRSPEQALYVAEPAMSDAKVKAGAVLSCCALLITVFRLFRSHIRYRMTSSIPLIVALWLTCIEAGYLAAAPWRWNISPYNIDVHEGILYSLGYAPALLTLLILNFTAYRANLDD